MPEQVDEIAVGADPRLRLIEHPVGHGLAVAAGAGASQNDCNLQLAHSKSVRAVALDSPHGDPTACVRPTPAKSSVDHPVGVLHSGLAAQQEVRAVAAGGC